MAEALAVVAIIAAGASAVQSARAGRENRRAARRQQNLDNLRMARERSQMVRQTHLERSRIIAAGASQGVLGSSGVQGGAGGVVTQGAENVAFSNQVQSIQNSVGRSLRRASALSSSAQTFGAISQMATSAIGFTGTGGGGGVNPNSPMSASNISPFQRTA